MNIVNINGETKVELDLKIKEMLLEFTLNCLLEQPDKVIPYTKEYFDKLLDEQSTFSIEENYQLSLDSDEDMHPSNFRRERTAVIYAEAFNPEHAEVEEEDKPVVYFKTDWQRNKLRQVVANCLLFRMLDSEQLDVIIDAMFERKVIANEYVIKEGEDGDNFYVIDWGYYDVFIKDNYVSTYENIGSFGELALMYNVPRSATVKAISPGLLWGLDRHTFRKIVVKGAFEKRKMYENFIKIVPMLQELGSVERANLADALVPKRYVAGDVIIKQGDKANGMYFVEGGKVEVRMVDKDNIEKALEEIDVGGYFGELALVTKHPRAATVVAVSSHVKCAFLDVEAFERLLGPCMDIMKRNIETYDKQIFNIFGEISLIGINMT